MIISIEEVILIIICVASYLTSMYTQVDDPNIEVSKADWWISFLWSVIGGFLAYKFFSFKIENPGEAWVYTVVISVISPRAFRFLANHNNQDRFFNSLFNKFTNKNKNDDNRDI